LRCGETGDGDAVGRAGHVVEANFVEECDGGRITSMLAADADLEVWAHPTSAGGPDLDQFADTGLVDRHERIDLDYAGLHIVRQYRGGVVPREAEARLRQIVGAERKELGTLLAPGNL